MIKTKKHRVGTRSVTHGAEKANESDVDKETFCLELLFLTVNLLESQLDLANHDIEQHKRCEEHTEPYKIHRAVASELAVNFVGKLGAVTETLVVFVHKSDMGHSKSPEL